MAAVRAVPSPAEVFWAAARPLAGGGAVTDAPRTPALFRPVLAKLEASTPASLLEHALWATSPDAATWWARQRRYTASLATTSMLGLVLGLGDRHPDNLLIDLTTVRLALATTTRIPEHAAAGLTVRQTIPGRRGAYRL
jgi:hypothetical protein